MDAGKGKRVMDRTRSVIADLQRAATATGASRQSDLRTQLAVFAVLATVLGIVGARVLLSLRRRQLQGAEELRLLNATLEQQVQQRTLHLERANRDLAAFAYSVAHDLRTPLRGISGFAESLVEDYGDRLDETGRDFAARVQAGCARMATLIDGLLQLSRVTRAEMNLQGVDLSAEVNAICAQLRARDPGRQVRVTVQEGVRVTADRTLIRSLASSLVPASAWPASGASSNATAAGPGPKAPSTAEPPSTSPSTRRTPHE